MFVQNINKGKLKMAILVDLSADSNYSKIDLKDVYIRIDRVQIQPKFGIMKMTVEGYVSSDVQTYIREIEQAQTDYASDFFEEMKSDIISGSLYNSVQEERSMLEPPPFTQDYPVALFNDVFTVRITEETASTKVDELYPVLYKMLKTDERFINVRDA